MTTPAPPAAPAFPLRRALWAVILPLLILDQATKWWIVANFDPPPPYQSIDVISGWFEIIRLHNTGVAFGMGNDAAWSNYLFGAIALGVLAALPFLYRRNWFPGRLGRTAAILLMAGIPGNVIDRFVHGYVVDFIHVRLPLYGTLFPSTGGWWPAFNVADSCITIAAVLLFISAFLPEKKSA